MKTKEELNELSLECKNLANKLKELSDDELKQVAGGASNDPLIVLDGIPFLGLLSDVAPGDIKSMDILKDASSSAIYGAIKEKLM